MREVQTMAPFLQAIQRRLPVQVPVIVEISECSRQSTHAD